MPFLYFNGGAMTAIDGPTAIREQGEQCVSFLFGKGSIDVYRGHEIGRNAVIVPLLFGLGFGIDINIAAENQL